MAQAVSFLLAKKVNRIILARPAVEAGEKLGFLPGDLQEKVESVSAAALRRAVRHARRRAVERLLERGTIEIAPIAFMRGRTLNDAFVILDEAQNTTSEQMKMFLTRLGFGSKAVITGDITQIDLPTGRISGLIEALKVVRRIEGIAFIHFDERTSSGTSWCSRSSRRTRISLAAARHPRPASADPRVPSCMASDPDPARPRLKVDVCDARGLPAAAPGLARWLTGVAPASARGAVTIVLATDARVRTLNREYRGKDYATDVLSFPDEETPGETRA